MRKLLTLIGLLLCFSTFGQIVVNQSISPGPYKVGDTITVTYTVERNNTRPRYFWLRYQFNNKALTYVSTTWSQGSQTQTFYTGWNNFRFTAKPNIPDTSLYGQYQSTPWNYTSNSDWNVGQLAIQRADQSINGVIATQRYVIKDQNTYNNIFRLDLSYAIDSASGNNIPFVRTTTGPSSIGGVTGNTSYFKVRVLFPQGYTITDHNVQLMHLKSDGSGDIDWSKQPIAQQQIDASGEAIFLTGVKVGDSIGVFVGNASNKSWMNNIITVSDAYKAFLGISQTDISGVPTFFTRPNFERRIANITRNDNDFTEADAYFMFAHVMGQNVSANAFIPTQSATSWRWYSGLLNQSWLDGNQRYRVYVTQPSQTVDAVFAWGGDLDWSHSSNPDVIAERISNGNFLNSTNATTKTMSNVYTQKSFGTATLSVSSRLENGKVVLTTNLTRENLAGLQVIMNYDETKLTLENVIFDAGSTITNFSTHDNNRLTFGSIDQLKTARIKTGTPYRLIFTPKVSLTNTAGLFFFVLADAVDASGNKIELKIE